MGPELCENWQLQGPQVMLLSAYPAQHPGGVGGGTALYSMIVLGFESLLMENSGLQHGHLSLVSAASPLCVSWRQELSPDPATAAFMCCRQDI